jgi:threonine/homoserine efflux transporter RhtA
MFFICDYAVYGICLLINDSLGIDNFPLNGTLLTLFETLGYITMYFTADKFSRKCINLTVNIGFLSGSLVLLALGLIDSSYKDSLEILKILETGRCCME